MNQVQLLASDPRTVHITSSYIASSKVTKTFAYITPRRIKVEPWARCHCACFVKTYRLICSMIYLGDLSGQVISPDLRSKFQIELYGSSRLVYDSLKTYRFSHDKMWKLFDSVPLSRYHAFKPVKSVKLKNSYVLTHSSRVIHLFDSIDSVD